MSAEEPEDPLPFKRAKPSDTPIDPAAVPPPDPTRAAPDQDRSETPATGPFDPGISATPVEGGRPTEGMAASGASVSNGASPAPSDPPTSPGPEVPEVPRPASDETLPTVPKRSLAQEFAAKWSGADPGTPQTVPDKIRMTLRRQEQILERDPSNVRIWYARGLTLSDLERHTEALLCFDRVTALEPNLRGVWTARAYLLRRLGREEEASESMRRGLLNVAKVMSPEQHKSISGTDVVSRQIETWRLEGFDVAPLERILQKDPAKAVRLGLAFAQNVEKIRQMRPAVERLATSGRDVGWALEPMRRPFDFSSYEAEVRDLVRESEALDARAPPTDPAPTPSPMAEPAKFRGRTGVTDAAPATSPLAALEDVRVPEIGPVPSGAAPPIAATEGVAPEPAPLARATLPLAAPPHLVPLPAPLPSSPRSRPLSAVPPNASIMNLEVGPPTLRRSGPRPRPRPVPGQSGPSILGGASGGARVRRKVLNGRTNGLGKGKTNGSGRTNGLTNGRRGQTNGLGKTNGSGKTNGLTNGLTNGRRGHTNGLTNGSRRTDVVRSGLVNGLQSARDGLTNGITNGLGMTNGLGSLRHAQESRATRWKLYLVPLFSLALLLAPLLSGGESVTARHVIIVDGSLAEWDSLGATRSVLPSSTAVSPNVDVTEAGFVTGLDYWGGYLRVRGTALAGDGVFTQDALRILIDADNDPSTGYDLGDAFGADHLLELRGINRTIDGATLAAFDGSAGRTDWNGWTAYGSVPAALLGAVIEYEIPQDWLDLGPAPKMTVLAQGWDGRVDRTPTLALGPRLTVSQQSLAPATVTSGTRDPYLQIALEAFEAPVRVERLILTLEGTADPGDLVVPPTLSGMPGFVTGRRVLFDVAAVMTPGSPVVYTLTTGIGPGSVGSTLGFSLRSPDDVLADGAAVTLETASSAQGLAYVETVLAGARVDGGFGDWLPENTSRADAAVRGNADIDLVSTAFQVQGTEVYAYAQVAGRLFAGQSVPVEPLQRPATVNAPDQDRDTIPDFSDPMPYDFDNDGTGDAANPDDVDGDGLADYPAGSDTLLETTIPFAFPVPFAGKVVRVYIGLVTPPPRTGEDTVRVYVDTDGVPAQGYLAGGLHADYLLQMTGKNGRVRDAGVYRFPTGATPGDGNAWQRIGTVRHFLDHSRLEIAADLGIPLNATLAAAYIEIEDAKGGEDAVSTLWPPGSPNYIIKDLPSGPSGTRSSLTDPGHNAATAGFRRSESPDPEESPVLGGTRGSEGPAPTYYQERDQQSFGYRGDVGAVLDSLYFIRTGDLDGDGDGDILAGIGAAEDYEIVVWQNDGTPFKGSWTSNDVGAVVGHALSVVPVDLDNDGDLDLASGAQSTENYEVIVWQNDGTPFTGLWTQNDVGASADNVWMVAAADFDGDNDKDIVSVSASAEDYEVILWQNDGTPFTGLWTQNDVGASTDIVTSVVVADFDKDTDVDIVTSSMVAENYEVIVWQNDGTPFTGLWTQNDVGASADSVRFVDVGDFDGDTWPDIVSASYAAEDYEVIVWQNDGTPFSGIWTNNSVGASTAGVYWVVAADLDNDADLDVASGGAVGEDFEVFVWQNDGTPFSGTWTQNDAASSLGAANNGHVWDLDGDGYKDIIVGYSVGEDFEVVIYRNDGTAFNDMWLGGEVGASADTVRSVATADFDNDGDLDIVSGSYNAEDYEVIVWQNDGTPFSGLWTQNDVGATGTATAYQVAVADFNNDGYADIVSGSNSAATYEVIVWKNDGTPFTGLWTTSGNVGQSADNVYTVATADLDKDGDMDIVSGSGPAEDYELIVWRNPLESTDPFTTSPWTNNSVGTSNGGVLSIRVADFDNDGRMDFVSGDFAGTGNEIVVWQNDGTPFTGTWTSNGISDTTQVNRFDVADFDNDGDVDFVSAGNEIGYELRVWQNDGTPFSGAWSNNSVGAPTTDVYGVSAADFDNDGYTDIVCGTQLAEDFDVIVWENDKTPFSGTWPQNDVGAVAATVYYVQSADLDNDGDMDIVSGSSNPENYEVRAWKNSLIHRNMPFSSAGNDVGNSADAVQEIATADLDNDGDLDLISGSYIAEDFEYVVWENDGTPFTGTWNQNDVGASTGGGSSVSVADFDNDGDIDIVAESYFSIYVYANDGSPFSGSWTSNLVGTGTDYAVDVDVGDLDDDGDVDIVSAFSWTEDFEAVVWQNDGTPFSGTWTPNDAGAVTSNPISEISVGDLNNDGFIDFADVSSSGEILVWQNDKTPFTGLWASNTVGDAGDSGGLGTPTDLDLDGDLDLVARTSITSPSTRKVLVYQNDGTPFSGTWSSNDVGTLTDYVRSVDPADFDKDGDIDIVSGSQTGEDFEVVTWLNDMTPFSGLWTQMDVGATATYAVSVATADLDADGRIDIVSGASSDVSNAELVAWRNVGTQVTEAVTDASASTMNKGASGAPLRIQVTHNGISTDVAIELETWKFKFYRSDGSTALTASEMSDTFVNYYVYLDDGDNAWTGNDVQVAASQSTSGNSVAFSFTDGGTSAAITSSALRKYFLVVRVSSSASMIPSFRVTFDPDGYGSGDYNEIENSNTGAIVSIQEASATQTQTITLVSIPSLSHLVTGVGAHQGDKFGWNVSYAGNVNNDGYPDLVVGAPYNDTADGSKADAGAAYIFFGYSTISAGTINAASANVTIYGATAGDHFGWSVSDLGNVDSDTKDDVIIGAPEASAGKVYIFYGRSSWSASYAASSADVTISGENSGDDFGSSVSGAGNFNNVNYNDIVVGAPSYDSNRGRAYVFLGDGSIPTSAGSADYVLLGESAGDRFGFSVSNAGDVDNDNKDDVIVGAPNNDEGGSNAGKAYVYFTDSTVYVASNSRTYGYVANFANAQSASDGGAYATLSEQDVANGGGTEYLYVNGLGTEKTGWTTVGSTPYLSAVDGTNRVYTASAGVERGDFTFADTSLSGSFSTSSVDLYSYQEGTGETVEAFLYDGSTWQSMGTISPDASYSWKSISTTSFLNSRTKLDAAKMYIKYAKAGAASNVHVDAGRLYWTFSPLYKMDLEFNTTSVRSADDYTLQLRYQTSGTETAFGVLVYNGISSGWDDLSSQGDLTATTLTEKEYSLGSAHRLGSGYVRLRFLGRNETGDVTNSTLSIDYHRIRSTIQFNGAAANQNLGWSLGNVSDINQDGSYDDVAVGVPGYYGGLGRVHLYHGGSPMNSVVDRTLTGDNPGDKFGYSVHSAGDINGGGVPDVVVGAPYYDTETLTDAGNVYVFFGGSSMDSTADYRHTGEQANGHFGWSVSMALNMDASGNAELVAGAPDHDDGAKTDAGKAEVLNISSIPEFGDLFGVLILSLVLCAGFHRRKRRRAGG